MAQQAHDEALAPTIAAGATITNARSDEVGLPCDMLACGASFAGRYRIDRFIAGGGMGEVYAARDELIDDVVAVKLLRADLIRIPGAQRRFADEIRLARKVTHVNVCRVFDAGVDGTRVYYTMELHDGETLSARLRREGKLALDAVRPIAAQLLAGIGAAHHADVIHVDLKPSNLLLSNQRVIVTDFGLALPCCATIECHCEMPHLVGTPAYMAPEQVEGGTLVGATDLFAVGVILYEMLTGQLPWRGCTAIELARARLTGPTPSPRAIDPAIDARWDEVIRACLQRDPSLRPRDAASVAASLGLA